MKKRLSCIILTLVMIISLVPFAAAASDEATEAAEALYELGLFKGTGTNPDGTPIFDLDKTPTRNQAIIMLVRLLGKEEEAKAGTWNIPFTDVSDSMKPYIGYAYTNGLTNGYTATTYNGTAPIKANQYVTFVLRALGYESGNDFEVTSPWELSNKIGITANPYSSTAFTRGDVALISLSALSCNTKDTGTPLFSVIQENGGIAKDIEFDAQQALKFTYCDDVGKTVHYEDKYIQNATVARIGDLYLFRIELLPDHFSRAYFFPAGYQSDDIDGYSQKVTFSTTDDADIATFFVTKEFIYKNPINRTSMVFDLKPILTAFPDDFKFAEGCADDCILLKIETRTLPR